VTRYLVYAALVLALGVAIWAHGYSRGELKLYDYQAEQAKASVAVVVKQGEVTERVVTRYVVKMRATENAANGIRTEVNRYAESNSGMCLDDDWRWLHDAAARGALPERPGGADGVVRAPTADRRGEGDDGLQRARHRLGELRAAPPLR